jgi:hypothetical protein
VSTEAPEPESHAAHDGDATYITGPHAWINWYAEQHGQPRREEAHPESVVINPIWEEFALHTDAPVGGPWLQLGPYEVVTLDQSAMSRLGYARKALILRMWDHLSDEPLGNDPVDADVPPTHQDVKHYYGGDVGDELAALLGLALGRRIRSGGSVRKGLPGLNAPLGIPGEMEHHPPALEPPRRDPMIPWLADRAALPDAQPLLETYPRLSAGDAVALVRAARQYVDGLWLADVDPRLAWIKLIGALEVAANHYDDSRFESPLDQLKRHRRPLWRELQKAPPEVAEAVAAELSRLYNTERKLRSFVKRFDPGPPAARPSPAFQMDWDSLDAALSIIYDHRSRDLHDGIAFPWVLCEPPGSWDDSGVPTERFWAEAVRGRGGHWSAARLPMYLHVFAHVAGGALRNWWAKLAAAAP